MFHELFGYLQVLCHFLVPDLICTIDLVHDYLEVALNYEIVCSAFLGTLSPAIRASYLALLLDARNSDRMAWSIGGKFRGWRHILKLLPLYLLAPSTWSTHTSVDEVTSSLISANWGASSKSTTKSAKACDFNCFLALEWYVELAEF